MRKKDEVLKRKKSSTKKERQISSPSFYVKIEMVSNLSQKLGFEKFLKIFRSENIHTITKKFKNFTKLENQMFFVLYGILLFLFKGKNLCKSLDNLFS